MYRISALTIAFFSLLVPLSAEFSFRGLIRIEKTTLFAVCDETSGRASWARIGDATEFGTLVEFNEENCTLVLLTKDGGRTELSMAPSVIQEARLPTRDSGSPAVFLTPELRAKLTAQGKNEASVLQDAIADIEREMAASEDPSDKLLLKEIIEGLRAGDFRIISTEGKPLRREEHPEMSQEKFDRINKLMQMTPEQVQAMIDTGADPKAPTEPAK